MLKSYKTLQNPAQDEFTVEKSRFIGQAAPISSKEEALAHIERIRKKHWEASHHVWAYILEADLQRFSDDGEPQGTAGIPVLEVLKKERIIHAMVVVTRYFGGIKLGAGGLARAYTKAAKTAIDASGVILRVPHLTRFATVDYPFLGQIQKEMVKLGFIIQDIRYTEKVRFEILTTPDQEHTLVEALMEISSGAARVTPGEDRYIDRIC
jgi:uncharacterized YigZ family protein